MQLVRKIFIFGIMLHFAVYMAACSAFQDRKDTELMILNDPLLPWQDHLYQGYIYDVRAMELRTLPDQFHVAAKLSPISGQIVGFYKSQRSIAVLDKDLSMRIVYNIQDYSEQNEDIFVNVEWFDDQHLLIAIAVIAENYRDDVGRTVLVNSNTGEIRAEFEDVWSSKVQPASGLAYLSSHTQFGTKIINIEGEIVADLGKGLISTHMSGDASALTQFSPDGLISTSTGNSGIGFSDRASFSEPVTTYSYMRTFEDLRCTFTRMAAWAPDQSYIAINSDCGDQQPALSIYNVKDDQIIGQYDVPGLFPDNMHWSPDSAQVALRAESEIIFVDVTTGELSTIDEIRNLYLVDWVIVSN